MRRSQFYACVCPLKIFLLMILDVSGHPRSSAALHVMGRALKFSPYVTIVWYLSRVTVTIHLRWSTRGHQVLTSIKSCDDPLYSYHLPAKYIYCCRFRLQLPPRSSHTLTESLCTELRRIIYFSTFFRSF